MFIYLKKIKLMKSRLVKSIVKTINISAVALLLSVFVLSGCGGGDDKHDVSTKKISLSPNNVTISKAKVKGASPTITITESGYGASESCVNLSADTKDGVSIKITSAGKDTKNNTICNYTGVVTAAASAKSTTLKIVDAKDASVSASLTVTISAGKTISFSDVDEKSGKLSIYTGDIKEITITESGYRKGDSCVTPKANISVGKDFVKKVTILDGVMSKASVAESNVFGDASAPVAATKECVYSATIEMKGVQTAIDAANTKEVKIAISDGGDNSITKTLTLSVTTSNIGISWMSSNNIDSKKDFISMDGILPQSNLVYTGEDFVALVYLAKSDDEGHSSYLYKRGTDAKWTQVVIKMEDGNDRPASTLISSITATDSNSFAAVMVDSSASAIVNYFIKGQEKDAVAALFPADTVITNLMAVSVVQARNNNTFFISLISQEESSVTVGIYSDDLISWNHVKSTSVPRRAHSTNDGLKGYGLDSIDENDHKLTLVQSTDAITWTTITADSNNLSLHYYPIFVNNILFYFYAVEDGSSKIVKKFSFDTKTWDDVKNLTSSNKQLELLIAYAEGVYIASTGDNKICRSIDLAANWQCNGADKNTPNPQATVKGDGQSFWSFAYGNKTLMLMSPRGDIWTSTNSAKP